MTDVIVQLRGVLEARIGETPHDAARRLRRERDDALAEVRRLRALPVLATCGACALHMPPDPSRWSIDYGWCGHDGAPGTESYDAKTDAASAPPAWCPMRGRP